ncbi:hypothetical protein ACFOJ6_20255 [Gordonia humi]|uniref:hypothetical protein n=1 Tax=Gordonia humi TaxID=686429 RepID=UPI00362312E6
MSASPSPALPVKTIASHVVVPALIGVVMALCYLGGFGRPDPHELPVDIVGPVSSSQQVGQELSATLGDKVEFGYVETVDEARRAVESREVSAAFVPRVDHAELLVSSAAGDPTAMVAERIFGAVAGESQTRLVITDVVPADADRDPSGQSLFFLLVALTVGAYGTGIAIAVAGGGRALRVRLAFAAVGAVVVSAAVVAIAAGFDVLPGSGWEVYGLAVPYALTTMLFAIGLHPLIGRFTTFAMVTIFVGLNFTSSGGVFAPRTATGVLRRAARVLDRCRIQRGGAESGLLPEPEHRGRARQTDRLARRRGSARRCRRGGRPASPRDPPAGAGAVGGAAGGVGGGGRRVSGTARS